MKYGLGHAKIALLLDANCLIYYCQRFDETFQQTAVKLYHPLGERVIKAINSAIADGRCVGSTARVLAEIPDKGAEELIDDFLCNAGIRDALERHGISRVPPRVVGRWQDRFTQKFKKLRNREWFREISFVPSQKELEDARTFYRSLAGRPVMVEHIARKGKDCPSEEDLGLALCAKELQVPLLTNDGDFTRFVEDWGRFGVIIQPLT